MPDTPTKWFKNLLSVSTATYFKDHAVLDRVVMPGACYLETILGFGSSVLGSQLCSVVVEDLEFQHPLFLSSDFIKYQTLVTECPMSENNYEVQIFSQNEDWKKHSSAKLRIDTNSLHESNLEYFSAEGRTVESSIIYETFRRSFIKMGPEFQSLKEFEVLNNNDMIFSVRELSLENREKYVVHPILLDAMMQAFWYFKVDKNSSSLPLILP